MSHVWLKRDEAGIWGSGRDQKGLVGKGQLILSMGLLWMEFCTLVQRPNTPSKGFLLLLITTHVLIIHYIRYTVYMLFVLLIFVSSAG
jgi:hypothetical protein